MMKARLALVLVLVLLCAGCQQENAPKTQDLAIGDEHAVITYHKDSRSAGNIRCDGMEYGFSRNAQGVLTITYPDGFVYTQRPAETGVAASDYDRALLQSKGYLDASDLAWGLENALDAAGTPAWMLWAAAAVLAVGLADVLFPQRLWRLSPGGRIEGAVPTPSELLLYRLGGGMVALAGGGWLIYLIIR